MCYPEIITVNNINRNNNMKHDSRPRNGHGTLFTRHIKTAEEDTRDDIQTT